ncbi:nucleotidyltransferase family protein [Pseudomonas sp. FEN]|uniref:nucleotidyltransferase family protein n=1 Tax=Pseudomonas sp. FEN TaxID=2767468 RepID=UPI00174E900D|nr:nucleotidyltransferase family protein [Pseudomonas sp. FEN]CAD5197959.1 Molybdenum cofactor cytidylyltransferase (EC 2.7.7.76) [Pseudomonas sp. FEN]
MSESVAAIVLAAGRGSRFRQAAGADQDKLLAPCVGRDGVERAVLEHVLLSLPQRLATRLLVTTADRLEVIRLARAYGCRVLLIESTGMGDSLAAAVAATADQAGWLVLLGDMPFILPETVVRVTAGIEDDAICVPVFQGEHGHPVGFGRAFGPALMGLSGDRGARPLFVGGNVREASVEDPGVLWDVDRPEHLIFL